MSKNPFLAFQNKEFKWFLWMRLFVIMAWCMQFVILEWEIYNITKSAWSLGIIGLMEVIPAFTFALFAGHFVDIWEKKKTLKYCLIFLFIISVAMCWVISKESINFFEDAQRVNIIYFLVFLGGIIRAFLIPTVFSLLGLIVPDKVKPNAASWSSSTWQLAAVLGPSIVGFTIDFIGSFQSMIIVVIMLVLSFLGLLNIKKKPVILQTKENIFSSLKEGIRFVFNKPVILNAITLDMFAVLFGGVMALLPIFATDILQVGSQGFGLLRAAPAIGGLLTMLVSTYINFTRKAGINILVCVFLFGVCIIWFGLSKSFWFSVILLFLSGLFDGVSVVIRQTILQLYTPDHMRGRVASVNSIFVGSSNELGAFESGFAAKYFGTINAAVFGGIITILVVVFMAIKSPVFRKLQIK